MFGLKSINTDGTETFHFSTLMVRLETCLGMSLAERLRLKEDWMMEHAVQTSTVEHVAQMPVRQVCASIPPMFGPIAHWLSPPERRLLVMMIVPRVYAQMTLQAWHQVAQCKRRRQLEKDLVRTVELLHAELEVANSKLQGRSELPGKAELVEKAVEHGFLTTAQAQSDAFQSGTAEQLRLLLKNATPAKEEGVLPKGLIKMKKEELRCWCMENLTEDNRLILYPYKQVGQKEAVKTRQEMIHSIREMSQNTSPPAATMSQSSR